MSGASPSEGSSSRSRCGLVMSARATASICCSPPDNVPPPCRARSRSRDRKSTRLNSSHANISYAVFCLKKKNKQRKDAEVSPVNRDFANKRLPFHDHVARIQLKELG